MRVLSLLAAAGFALAASPAFAACGDPGTSPSVAGKTYTGSDMNLGTTARRPTISHRTVFNPDCTTTQTVGNGGVTKTFKGSWSQVGKELKINRTEPVKGGRPVQIPYVGVVGDDGRIKGQWRDSGGKMRDFELFPAKDAFPCGQPGTAGDLSGTTFKGNLVSDEGVKVPVELELNSNCSAFMFGLDYTYVHRWKQTNGKLVFTTQGRGWTSTFDGARLKGRIDLIEGWRSTNPFVPRADWSKTQQPPGENGQQRGSFDLTRQK